MLEVASPGAAGSPPAATIKNGNDEKLNSESNFQTLQLGRSFSTGPFLGNGSTHRPRSPSRSCILPGVHTPPLHFPCNSISFQPNTFLFIYFTFLPCYLFFGYLSSIFIRLSRKSLNSFLRVRSRLLFLSPLSPSRFARPLFASAFSFSHEWKVSNLRCISPRLGSPPAGDAHKGRVGGRQQMIGRV